MSQKNNNNTNKFLENKIQELEQKLNKITPYLNNLGSLNNISQKVNEFEVQLENMTNLHTILEQRVNDQSSQRKIIQNIQTDFIKMQKQLQNHQYQQELKLKQQYQEQSLKFIEESKNQAVKYQNSYENYQRKLVELQTTYLDYKNTQNVEWERLRDYLNKNLKTKPGEKEAERKIQELKEQEYREFQEDCQTKFKHIFEICGMIHTQQENERNQKRLIFVENNLKEQESAYTRKFKEIMSKNEKQLRKQNINQQYILEEIQKFNDLNSNRLLQDLEEIEQKTQILKKQSQQNDHQDFSLEEVHIKEYNILKNHFHDIIVQIQGIERKFVLDQKIIQQNQKEIIELKSKVHEQMNKQNKLSRVRKDLDASMALGQQVEELSSQIQYNQQCLKDNYQNLDEKFDLVKKVLNPLQRPINNNKKHKLYQNTDTQKQIKQQVKIQKQGEMEFKNKKYKQKQQEIPITSNYDQELNQYEKKYFQKY